MQRQKQKEKKEVQAAEQAKKNAQGVGVGVNEVIPEDAEEVAELKATLWTTEQEAAIKAKKEKRRIGKRLLYRREKKS